MFGVLIVNAAANKESSVYKILGSVFCIVLASAYAGNSAVVRGVELLKLSKAALEKL